MEQFANLARSVLSGAILAADATLTVTDASTFPVDGTFRVIIDAEIIRVDSVAGAVFTITRGDGGTVAADHSDLSTVTGIITAEALLQMRADAKTQTYFEAGVAPFATVGELRFGNVAGIAGTLAACRNFADDNDLTLLEASAADDSFWLGTDSVFTTAKQLLNLTVGVRTGGLLKFIVGDGVTSALSLNDNNILGTLPYIGDASPYGGHGDATIDMADGDYTILPADYAAFVIINGTATTMTAPRTLTVPNAAAGKAYYKFFRNEGAEDVTVVDVAVGTSVVVVAGFGALLGVKATGVFRMGPDVAN